MILFSEDVLLEQAARRILAERNPGAEPVATMGNRGFQYFESRLREIRRSSNGIKFIIFLDGDALKKRCIGDVIREWFGSTKPHNICIRFAIPEVENWILADRTNIARFLKVSQSVVPDVDDGVHNAKELLVRLARRSNSREVSEDLAPRSGHSARVGPAYNVRLSAFLAEQWNLDEACSRCSSLARACAELAAL